MPINMPMTTHSAACAVRAARAVCLLVGPRHLGHCAMVPCNGPNGSYDFCYNPDAEPIDVRLPCCLSLPLQPAGRYVL